MRSLRTLHILRQLFQKPYLRRLLLIIALNLSRHVRNAVRMHNLSLRRLRMDDRLLDHSSWLTWGRVFLDIERVLQSRLRLRCTGHCRNMRNRGLFLYRNRSRRISELRMHSVLDNRLRLLGFLRKDKLIRVHFQPRIKLNNQITLIYLILQVHLHLPIIFTLKRIIIPKMMVKSLKDEGELILEVLVLLGLRGAWVFEFC